MYISSSTRYSKGFVAKSLSGLGDAASDAVAQSLVAQGWDSGTIQMLIGAGASADDLSSLSTGNNDVDSLMTKLTGNPNWQSTGGSGTQAAALQADASAQAAQLQQAAANLQSLANTATTNASVRASIGQQLAAAQAQYAALYKQYQDWLNSWSTAILSFLMYPPTLGQDMSYVSQLNALKASIAQMQQEVSAAAAQSQTANVAQVSSTQYAALAAQAYAAGNKSLGDQYSSLANQAQQTATAAAQGAPAPTAASNFLSWIENNAGTVAIVFAALILGPPLIKKL